MDVYYLFASSVAALIARVCTHPIDTIKTRLQIRSSSEHGGFKILSEVIFQPSTSGSQPSALATVRSLYRGLPVTLLFSVPALSVYLTCYETTKASLHMRGGLFAQDGVLNHLVSGCAAEVAAGTLFTPMEVMKNRLQTQRTHSAMSMAGHIWRTEGVPGFFRGYWMGLAVFVPHTMTYFAVYEQCKMIYADRFLAAGHVSASSSSTDAAQLPLTAYLLCSSIASALGIMLSTPLDIVKTRWQVSAAEQGVDFRQGPVAIIKHMWHQEGRWRAFTRGLGARIAWGIPTTAISMTVFELLKDWRANKELQQ